MHKGTSAGKLQRTSPQSGQGEFPRFESESPFSRMNMLVGFVGRQVVGDIWTLRTSAGAVEPEAERLVKQRSQPYYTDPGSSGNTLRFIKVDGIFL